MKREPLTTGQIAEYCHVTMRAVLKWVDEGKLKAYRTPGKHSRVEVADFIEFLNSYDMPVPPELLEDGGKARILIVDDDKEMVNSIRRMLLLENRYVIEAAYDGFQAGEKFAEFQPDVVILDIKMPGLDGYQVCAQIRQNEENKEVKIIAVSGIVGVVGGEKILAAGADEYLPKPFDNQELKKRIEKLLGIKTKKEEAPAKDKNKGKKIVSLLLSFFLLFSNTFAYAFENGFNIRQESSSENGVYVSKPNNEDAMIAQFIYTNKINSLEDYSSWLQNNIHYEKAGGTEDWSKPAEIIERKKGDCDDFAVLTSAVARVMGYQPRFIALIRKAKGTDETIAHAVCVFQHNGNYVWFDNGKLIRTQAKTMDEFGQYITANYQYIQLSELNAGTQQWSTVYKKS